MVEVFFFVLNTVVNSQVYENVIFLFEKITEFNSFGVGRFIQISNF